MPSPSRTKGRSYAIPNDDDVLVWHPCPGENFLLGIPGYGEHPIRSMYGWTHHESIIHVFCQARFSWKMDMDQVVEGEDERYRAPEGGIKSWAKIDLWT